MKKTIFGLINASLMLTAVIGFAAIAGIAQDPCTDAAGLDAKQQEFDKFWEERKNPDLPKQIEGREKALNSGKEFLDKYGSCPAAQVRADWLKTNLPKHEATLKQMKAKGEQDAVIKRFNTALAGKNWDEVYASGRDLMNRWPADFNGLELTLGSIGYDELFNNNQKYTDQTMQYAKQSLADLQAGKDFKPGYGVAPFVYKSKEDATAWMNLTIGTLYQLGKKDKASAMPYLYAATQAPATSDVSKNPNPYEFIGNYYFDELNKVIADIKTMSDKQAGITNADELKALVEQIKAKVAMSNGISERAMDAFARAYALGTKPEYKTKMKSNVADAYKVRYGATGPVTVDQFIASTTAKPFVNPTTPVAPISDPDPVKTTSGETAAVTPATGVGTSIKPVSTTTTTVKTTTTTVKTTPAAVKPVTGGAKKPGVAAKTVATKKKRG